MPTWQKPLPLIGHAHSRSYHDNKLLVDCTHVVWLVGYYETPTKRPAKRIRWFRKEFRYSVPDAQMGKAPTPASVIARANQWLADNLVEFVRDAKAHPPGRNLKLVRIARAEGLGGWCNQTEITTEAIAGENNLNHET